MLWPTPAVGRLPSREFVASTKNNRTNLVLFLRPAILVRLMEVDRDAQTDSIKDKLDQIKGEKKKQIQEKLEKKKEDVNRSNLITVVVLTIFCVGLKDYICLLCNSTSCFQSILLKNRRCCQYFCCFLSSHCLRWFNINSRAVDDSYLNNSNLDETVIETALWI